MAGGSQSFFTGTQAVIVYLVSADHAYTLNRYLQEWAPELRNQIQPVFYEEDPWDWLDEAATYVFSDIERLTPSEMQKATTYAEHLRSRGFHVLNHPRNAPTRLALQNVLHEAGINPFRMFPVKASATLTFPVFLRLANSHLGSIGDLIHSQEELDQRLAGLDKKISQADDLVVVEYCDTRTGTARYTKYSAMRVADKIVPRHAISSDQWMLKVPDIVDAEAVAVENEFLNEFPQRTDIANIFSLANIDFGRIDFGMQDGKIRVWEINTNPTFMPMKKGLHIAREQIINKTNSWLIEALKELNKETGKSAIWEKIARRHERKRRVWWLQRKLFRPKRA